MNVKALIYKLIQSNTRLMNIYIYTVNKLSGGLFNLAGIKIRNNKIALLGEKNSINVRKDCSLQNTIMEVVGDGNMISIYEDSEFLGGSFRNIYIHGNNNSIVIEKGCKLTDVSFFIAGNNNQIHISENYSGIGVEFHIEQNDNKVFIGKNTTMHGRGVKTVHFALDEGTKIIIGEDCMFSNDIQIRTSDSHSIVDLKGNRLNPAKDIIIGNHCWIGLRSMILKGTEISDNTMVAGGSICTKKYLEKNVIIAGNPAKMVKNNVNWDRKFL